MVTEKSYQRRAFNLANAIQSRARIRNGCYGSYCLIISGRPQIPKPTSHEGKNLILVANMFIDKTGRTEVQVCEELLKNEEGSIMIQNEYKIYTGRKVAILFCDKT